MSADLSDITETSVRGGLVLFAGNTLSTIILAVNSVIVARLLGPEGYGRWALVLVVPSLLHGLVDVGVNAALTRFTAKLLAEGERNRAAAVVRVGLTFKLLVGVAMAALCFVFADTLATSILNRPDMVFLVRLASPLILLRAVLESLSAIFIGLDQTKSSTLVTNLQSMVKLASSPMLVVVGFGVVGALLGHIAGSAVASIVGSMILVSRLGVLGKLSREGFSNTLKVMLSYGFPLYSSALLTLLVGQYNTILLAFFASNVEIGNFTVATTLAATANLLVFPLRVLFPAFAKVKPTSTAFKTLFDLSLRYTTMLLVPSALLMAILSNDLVSIFYGSEYMFAPRFLSIYVVMFLYASLGSMILDRLLKGVGDTTTVFKANLIVVATLIPLAPICMLFGGIVGLIVAMLISNLSSHVYRLYVASKRFDLAIDIASSLKIYGTSLASTLPVLVFLHLTHVSSIANFVVGCALYLVTFMTLAPLTKTISRQDVVTFRTISNNGTVLKTIMSPLLRYEELILERS